MSTQKNRQVLAKEGITRISIFKPKFHQAGEPLDVAWMIEAYQYGATKREVAQALGVSEQFLYTFLREHPDVLRQMESAQAVGAISAKKKLFQLGMVGKFQALSGWLVNNTDFSYAGRPPENREDAVAALTTSEMSSDDLFARMADEINKLPVADRSKFMNLIEGGVIPTPKVKKVVTESEPD